MTTREVRASAEWLALREPADAAARSRELTEQLRSSLPTGGVMTIHDFGCGTGSMARWLAPQLPGPQHWVMHDRDAELLSLADRLLPEAAADGSPVTVETRQRDITEPDADELAGATLITASALLDMMTAEELERLVATCAAADCPVLITLSVTGRVDLVPADPFDPQIADAFNAHQRRTTGVRTLLGPDAFGVAVDSLTELGLDVLVRPSPWRLGPGESALAVEWFNGWVGAACEQRPELVDATDAYSRRRLAEVAAGQLSITVHHSDLLAVPR